MDGRAERVGSSWKSETERWVGGKGGRERGCSRLQRATINAKGDGNDHDNDKYAIDSSIPRSLTLPVAALPHV